MVLSEQYLFSPIPDDHPQASDDDYDSPILVDVEQVELENGELKSFDPSRKLLFETNNEKFGLRRVKSKKLICGHRGGNLFQSGLSQSCVDGTGIVTGSQGILGGSKC